MKSKPEIRLSADYAELRDLISAKLSLSYDDATRVAHWLQTDYDLVATDELRAYVESVSGDGSGGITAADIGPRFH